MESLHASSQSIEFYFSNIPILIALASFLFSLFVFAHSLLKQKKDVESRRRDEYWFRLVIFPIIMEPLKEMMLEKNYAFIGDDDEDIESFIARLDDVERRIEIIESIFPCSSIVERIKGILDNYSEDITGQQDLDGVVAPQNRALYPGVICFNKIIGELSSLHFKLDSMQSIRSTKNLGEH